MLSLPKIVERPSTPYAFVTFTVPMNRMKEPADQGFPLLFDFLGSHGITPTGAPFYNYRRIDMTDTLDVEAGVPVGASFAGEGRVQCGTLPAGRFVRMDHQGHYDELYDVTAMLIGWAKERDMTWDVREAADGDHFACRLEIYETDPDQEPDPAKWKTTLMIKLRD